MLNPSPLPGQRWFSWIHSAPVRIGVLTGIYLGVVLSLWLAIANRIPWTEHFAGPRNMIALALSILVTLIPVGRFLRSPAQLFASGMTAWAVYSFSYAVLGFVFS